LMGVAHQRETELRAATKCRPPRWRPATCGVRAWGHAGACAPKTPGSARRGGVQATPHACGAVVRGRCSERTGALARFVGQHFVGGADRGYTWARFYPWVPMRWSQTDRTCIGRLKGRPRCSCTESDVQVGGGRPLKLLRNSTGTMQWCVRDSGGATCRREQRGRAIDALRVDSSYRYVWAGSAVEPHGRNR
jgi:hypothetical protein